MSDMSFFFTSMSSVMNQWSDFKVARNMYRSYFDMQKKAVSDAISDAKNDNKQYTNANDSIVSDKLKSLSDNLAGSANKLSDAVSSDDFDIEKVYSAAENFVTNYNNYISATNDSANASLVSKNDYLKNMSGIYADRFQKAGISVNNDGTLAIDKEKFMAADTTNIKNILGDKNSFATYTSKHAGMISKFAESDAYLNNKTYYDPSGSLNNSLNNNVSLLSGYMYNNFV